jgi:hypothetical protein
MATQAAQGVTTVAAISPYAGLEKFADCVEQISIVNDLLWAPILKNEKMAKILAASFKEQHANLLGTFGNLQGSLKEKILTHIGPLAKSIVIAMEGKSTSVELEGCVGNIAISTYFINSAANFILRYCSHMSVGEAYKRTKASSSRDIAMNGGKIRREMEDFGKALQDSNSPIDFTSSQKNLREVQLIAELFLDHIRYLLHPHIEKDNMKETITASLHVTHILLQEALAKFEGQAKEKVTPYVQALADKIANLEAAKTAGLKKIKAAAKELASFAKYTVLQLNNSKILPKKQDVLVNAEKMASVFTSKLPDQVEPFEKFAKKSNGKEKS